MKGVFSAALLRAAENENFRFWYSSVESEVNYALRKFTDYAELLVIDEGLTRNERTLFLLFLAEVFKEHRL